MASLSVVTTADVISNVPAVSVTYTPFTKYELILASKSVTCELGIAIFASSAAVNLPCASTVNVGTAVALP